MHKIHLLLRLLKIPLDFLAVLAAVLLAYYMRITSDFIPGVQIDIVFIPPFEEYLWFALAGALFYVLIGACGGLYALKRSTPLRFELIRVMTTAFVWLMLVITAFFVAREFFFSRLVLGYAFLWIIIFTVLVRLGMKLLTQRLLDRGIGRINALIIGKSDITKSLTASMQKTRMYRIVGTIIEPVTSLENITIDGTTRSFEEQLSFRKVEEVIIVKQPQDPLVTSAIVDICRQRHVRFRLVPDVMELQLTNIEVSWMREIPLITLQPTPLDGWGRVVKRGTDIVGSIIGIVLLSPLLLIVAVAQLIERKDPREIIFVQNRYGHHGKLFRFLKFQSMRKGANAEHAKLIAEQQGERKGLLKIKNDPRVTKLGRFLRKTSIDELPQLFNVLKGDMSLVGPRPHMPEEIDQLTREYHRVLCVKPGITSLAQINGRSNLDFEDEMRLDITYIEHWTFFLDFVILFKTVTQVLFKRDNVS